MIAPVWSVPNVAQGQFGIQKAGEQLEEVRRSRRGHRARRHGRRHGRRHHRFFRRGPTSYHHKSYRYGFGWPFFYSSPYYYNSTYPYGGYNRSYSYPPTRYYRNPSTNTDRNLTTLTRELLSVEDQIEIVKNKLDRLQSQLLTEKNKSARVQLKNEIDSTVDNELKPLEYERDRLKKDIRKIT